MHIDTHTLEIIPKLDKPFDSSFQVFRLRKTQSQEATTNPAAEKTRIKQHLHLDLVTTAVPNSRTDFWILHATPTRPNAIKHKGAKA